MICFDEKITADFEEASRREWLETNGLGGWASSTLCGSHSRRYHGLLVAALAPPVNRQVLISKLDETLITENNRTELGCNRYPNAIHPQGYRFLKRFSHQLFPIFDYESEGIRLRKTVAALQGENSTLLLYEIQAVPAASTMLELRPFLAMRGIHALSHAREISPQITRPAPYLWRLDSGAGAPALYVSISGADFSPQPDWYYRFEYEMERLRWLDFQEDLFTPGVFVLPISSGKTVAVLLSLENPQGRDPLELFARESRRRKKLTAAMPAGDEICANLVRAADQFVVQRGEKERSIIAGYHWFSDWGRDTMISLPGLCLVTGRFEDARKILIAFRRAISQGMLPNRFPEAGEPPEYNTADATLWFFVAVYQYLRYSGNRRFVQEEMLPALLDIIEWHERGTRYGIHVAADGLLCAGEKGHQLTWMDARVGDWVVTPRQGKPVEINALWYNALMICARLAGGAGRQHVAEELRRKASRAKKAFNHAFWNEARNCLYDCLDDNRHDDAIRPNQIFAISLPFPLLNKSRARQVLSVVEKFLLTDRGLRSLARGEPHYHPRYSGDAATRDGAYHQGTVWGWLLGPFITALVKVKGESGRRQAMTLIDRLQPHLGEAGITTISEIFDGDPPHAPHGCIAQAWSVAEVLRAYMEDVKGIAPGNNGELATHRRRTGSNKR